MTWQTTRMRSTAHNRSPSVGMVLNSKTAGPSPAPAPLRVGLGGLGALFR